MISFGLLLLGILLFAEATSPRFDCYPELGATQDACIARGCTWSPATAGIPSCIFKDGVGYKLNSKPDANTFNLIKNNGPKNPWGGDNANINLTTTNYASILNVKIGVDGKYEVPINFPRTGILSSEKLILNTRNDSDTFSFSVVRASTNRTLFDTSIGGLIFSDQFIQLATYLPSENVYGWGENVHQQLKHNFDGYLTWAMLARDQPPDSGSLNTGNLYGVHPFYMVVEPDGKTHGVLILNSNAQEVTTAPGPSLIYRTIGGILDLYFFPGPTPEIVTQQYLQFIGLPFLPAYWGLGYQLSRYGYKDLNDMQTRIQAVRNAGIPLDIGVADIDYMNRFRDFTTSWDGFNDYVKQLHDDGMKLILIFDPPVAVDYDSFQRAKTANAKFIEWESQDQVQQEIQNLYPLANNTKIMLGIAWPDKHVAYPDFFDTTQNTQNWWIDEFVRFQKVVQFDGIWLDMNEPAVIGTNNLGWYSDKDNKKNLTSLVCPTNGTNKYDMPPYQTHAVWNYGNATNKAFLSTNTLCLTGVQDGQRFYNVKNLYGLTQTRSTLDAMHKSTGKRGVVVTRSTFPSSGRYSGHWLGDNTARWEDLRTSIIGIQEFNIFGIPYVGADVCGFIGNTTEELCLRWQQLGAFYSFFRNHNDIDRPAQDPAVWPSVTAATKEANYFRYHYLPHLYSLHFQASHYGATVVRPVFFEFPTDNQTYNLSYEFMWGSKILVAPVVYPGATSVNVYLPDDRWYSIGGSRYGELITPGYTNISAPTTSRIPVFIRGPTIIPRQTPNITTTASRKNPFELLIAPCIMGLGYGTLYWDDGETIITNFDNHNYHEFNFFSNITSDGFYLNITHKKNSTVPLPTLDIIEILNYPTSPNFNSFTLNEKSISIDSTKSSYSDNTKILYISTTGFIDLNSADNIELRWTHSNSATSYGVFFVLMFSLYAIIL